MPRNGLLVHVHSVRSVEVCTLNRQLTDIDVGTKLQENAIHNTSNYNRKFGDRSSKVKGDFVKRKQEPKVHRRKNSSTLIKCNYIDKCIDLSSLNTNNL
jgi:hypothetical protein